MNALNTGIYNWTIIAQGSPETVRYHISVRPKDCAVSYTSSSYFTITKKPQKNNSSSSTIPSFNISIVIWTLIWINISIIIFIKKKYDL